MKLLSVLSSLALTALAIPTAAVFVLPTPGVGPFIEGGGGGGAFTVSSVSLTPAVPCITQKMCLTVSGHLSADIIEGAALHIVGRFFNRIVYVDDEDVGALMAAAGTPLPFPASAPGTNSTLKLCTPFKKGFGFFSGVNNIR